MSKAYSMGLISKSKYEKAEVLELEHGGKIFLLNDLPLLISFNETLIPTLFNSKIKGMLFFRVDDGAVPHILNGADIMAPGIIEYPTEIKEGMLVTVKSRGDDFLAIARVLENPLDKLKNRKGKVLSNLHYKHDRYYNVSLELIKKKLSK